MVAHRLAVEGLGLEDDGRGACGKEHGLGERRPGVRVPHAPEWEARGTEAAEDPDLRDERVAGVVRLEAEVPAAALAGVLDRDLERGDTVRGHTRAEVDAAGADARAQRTRGLERLEGARTRPA